MKRIWLFIIILVALVIAAIKFLPWWASLLVLLCSLLGVRWSVNLLLQSALIAPFKKKSQVLAQANIQVQGVQPAPAPSLTPEAPEAFSKLGQPRQWYYLYVTITPAKRYQESATWQPNELLLVDPKSKSEDLGLALDDSACFIYRLQVWANQAYGEPAEKYQGSQRLQLYVGVHPETRHLKFRYYFELFGDIFIPAQSGEPPPSPDTPTPALANPSISPQQPIPVQPSPSQQIPQPSSQSPSKPETISPELIALAKGGDMAALATLLNLSLQPRGVRAKIRIRETTLKVLLEAPTLPRQSKFAPMVYKGIAKLKIQSITQLQVHGRHMGEKEPAWTETFVLSKSGQRASKSRS